MKYNCDLISDLLPLYKDEICSEASRKIIEEHLAECPDCKKMLNSLNDVTIDEKIVKEKEEVRWFNEKKRIQTEEKIINNKRNMGYYYKNIINRTK